jgi:hypothetical protein
MWADYKTSAGIEPALFLTFHPLEEALAAMGVVVWPMIAATGNDVHVDLNSVKKQSLRGRTKQRFKGELRPASRLRGLRWYLCSGFCFGW